MCNIAIHTHTLYIKCIHYNIIIYLHSTHTLPSRLSIIFIYNMMCSRGGCVCFAKRLLCLYNKITRESYIRIYICQLLFYKPQNILLFIIVIYCRIIVLRWSTRYILHFFFLTIYKACIWGGRGWYCIFYYIYFYVISHILECIKNVYKDGIGPEHIIILHIISCRYRYIIYVYRCI